MTPPLTLEVERETWPLAGAFVISRGAKTEATVVVARLSDGSHAGRGECVPYARYGETVDGVMRDILAFGAPESRTQLATMSPGAARNALDCALWDLEAKRSGRTAADLAGVSPLSAVDTCLTLSLGTPEAMAASARAAHETRILKLKLGGAGDAERMAAVRAARPDARLIVDANEAWSAELIGPFFETAERTRVELIEQPLPAGEDAILARMPRRVPVCADESAHTSADLPALIGRYDAVNIKLDKAGGLTEALAMAGAARAAGLKIMVGSMVATSLAMAPALLLAQGADWVDLDSPLLLAKDRPHGLTVSGGRIAPPSPELWG